MVSFESYIKKKTNGTSTMLKHSQTKHAAWTTARLKSAGHVKPGGLREMAMRAALTEAAAVLCG